MRPYSPDNPHAWMDERLEAYVDGDLAPAEARRMEALLAESDADWEAELFLATRIRAGLQALPQPACPPAVAQVVLEAARRQAVERAGPGWLERAREWFERAWAPFWQPTLATAALVAVVVATALVGRPRPEAELAGMSPAQVEAALAEAKWTLAYLSQVGRDTGHSVRQEVLENHVVAPVQQALGSILTENPNIPN